MKKLPVIFGESTRHVLVVHLLLVHSGGKYLEEKRGPQRIELEYLFF